MKWKGRSSEYLAYEGECLVTCSSILLQFPFFLDAPFVDCRFLNLFVASRPEGQTDMTVYDIRTPLGWSILTAFGQRPAIA